MKKVNSHKSVKQIIQSRKSLVEGIAMANKTADEGGCGVVGFTSTKKQAGKHLFQALVQMKNRGNGKGGGVAIVGLSAEQLKVSEETLHESYILQIAYIDESIREELEQGYIFQQFEVVNHYRVETLDDYEAIDLDVEPPQVHRYFCKIKAEVLAKFQENSSIQSIQDASDEFVYQNSYRLNVKYYASTGEKQAFVLSHGKNLLVFKLVGFAHQVIQFYGLDEFQAHIWIGHHRYPTKGTVWHPGGAHPFIGLNEALVHNGDFSNYHAVSEYLAQRNIYPLFLTDTEVAAYLFDLYSRVYKYPTEYLIEAIAPTTELDFHMLSEERQKVYAAIQHSHLRGSPDGPWFFIVGRTIPQSPRIELLGITDTSMLRPQVFALQKGEFDIGLIASERQAIDAVLSSIHQTDPSFAKKADIYWNARGGSHTDGGAFIFSYDYKTKKLECRDKFGEEVLVPTSEELHIPSDLQSLFTDKITNPDNIVISMQTWAQSLIELASTEDAKMIAMQHLSLMLDSLHRLPNHKNGWLVTHIEHFLYTVLRSFSPLAQSQGKVGYLEFSTQKDLREPITEEILVIDIADYPMEGPLSAAMAIVEAYHFGWRHVIAFDWRGQRFAGSGLGSDSTGFTLEIYGNPGDYLASGLDGASIIVHTSVQDQVGQMMKSGTLVVYGDVGQTFMYGAKGGDVFILGNAAGRPLINAVGSPKVVINGTCLDYLAESFMAGNPPEYGGFVVVNGIQFNNRGDMVAQDDPYPGGNLLSLASGGAIYIRDPLRKVHQGQLNSGEIVKMIPKDIAYIQHHLSENEKYFGISPEVLDLSKYRKVIPSKLTVLSS